MKVFTMFMDLKIKYCNILILSLDSIMCQLKKKQDFFQMETTSWFQFFFIKSKE